MSSGRRVDRFLSRPAFLGYRRCLASRAYTLLELVVVLVIIASLFGVSWPALMKPFRRSHVQDVGERLADQIRRARLLAIEHGEVLQIRYQLGGQAYEIRPLQSKSQDEFFCGSWRTQEQHKINA